MLHVPYKIQPLGLNLLAALATCYELIVFCHNAINKI